MIYVTLTLLEPLGYIAVGALGAWRWLIWGSERGWVGDRWLIKGALLKELLLQVCHGSEHQVVHLPVLGFLGWGFAITLLILWGMRRFMWFWLGSLVGSRAVHMSPLGWRRAPPLWTSMNFLLLRWALFGWIKQLVILTSCEVNSRICLAQILPWWLKRRLGLRSAGGPWRLPSHWRCRHLSG